MKQSRIDRVKQSFRNGESIDKALTRAALAAKKLLKKDASKEAGTETTRRR